MRFGVTVEKKVEDCQIIISTCLTTLSKVGPDFQPAINPT